MPVSAEGQVEQQKRNKTATFKWPVGFVFGVQLDYSCQKKSDPPDAENRVKKSSYYEDFTMAINNDDNVLGGHSHNT